LTLIDDILTNPNLIAFLALLISIVSIIVGFSGLWIQYIHNKKSVRPLGNIEIHDKVSEISLILCNNGIGPMEIISFDTEDKQGRIKNHPADWIPWRTLTVGYYFKSYSPGDNVRAGNDEVFLNFKFEPTNKDEEKILNDERKLIRRILKDLTIRIRYSNIYGDEQKEIEKKLEGFGVLE
jgi:hypothetical protein